MIRYLKHNEIDYAMWDRCIERSVNGMVYAYTWYLDIVSPGWEALEEDDYTSVFPLPCFSKLGVGYLRQPPFTQQLGLFSMNPLSEETVTAYLNAIPTRYRLAEIHLNSFNRVNSSLFSVEMRRNHELELIRHYEPIAAGYSQNTRRNIRKATEAGVTVRRKIDPDDLIRLFRDNFGKKKGRLPYRDYLTITRLITHSLRNSAGIIIGAGTGTEKLDAAAFFLKDRNRYIFLFSASDFTTRDNGAMFLLLDTFIREHCNRPMILDFEGGHVPNLGRFYKNFGASESGYPMVRLNRLSPLMDTGLALYKKIRGK